MTFRKATKVRNVVERLFAQVKKWRLLRYEHDIHYDPMKIHHIFLIVCSFWNAFGSPLYADLSAQDEDTEYILSKQHITTNQLATAEAKESSGWSALKDKPLRKIVPKFNLQHLRRLCCGPYQLHLAIPYFQHAQHIKYIQHTGKSKTKSRWPRSIRAGTKCTIASRPTATS